MKNKNNDIKATENSQKNLSLLCTEPNLKTNIRKRTKSLTSEEREERENKRKENNRLSASNSRKKKKERLKQLSNEIDKLREENHRLSVTNLELNAMLKYHILANRPATHNLDITDGALLTEEVTEAELLNTNLMGGFFFNQNNTDTSPPASPSNPNSNDLTTPLPLFDFSI